jgi:hypothetical protein
MVAHRFWSSLGWIACGGLGCAITLWFADPWQGQPADSAPPPLVISTPQPSAPSEPMPPPRNEPPADTGLDVLGRLASAARESIATLPRSSTRSDTLADAFTRSQASSDFSGLIARRDPESLFQAAAWVRGCIDNVIPKTEPRCQDTTVRDPALYAQLLRQAASEGHPGAVLELVTQNPTQWNVIVLPDSRTLLDHLFAMAAAQDIGALEMLKQLCAMPDACQDARLARNTLTVLKLGKAHSVSPSQYGEYLEGTAKEQQQAIQRAAQLAR